MSTQATTNEGVYREPQGNLLHILTDTVTQLALGAKPEKNGGAGYPMVNKHSYGKSPFSIKKLTINDNFE